MYLMVEGFACLRGKISLPLTGAWVADVAIDPATSGASLPDYGSQVTLYVGEGGFSLTGAVRRINNAFDTVYARLVGGAGGLWETVGPKSYQNTTFGIIASDLLSSVSETLSPSVPAAIQNIMVNFWTVPEQPMFQALANLIVFARIRTQTEVNWRVLTDGTIFVGVEQWPNTQMSTFDLMSWSPAELEATIYAPDPRLVPGEIFQSSNVSNVEHVVIPEKARTRVWFMNP